MNQTIEEQAQAYAVLQQSLDNMNQTIEEQAQANVLLQQALNEMNQTSTQDVQELLNSISMIQSNITASQDAISSIILELQASNSTDADLLSQLLATQASLNSFLSTSLPSFFAFKIIA